MRTVAITFIALTLLCVPTAHALAIDVLIDGADKDWEGNPLPYGQCRLVIDNRGNPEMAWVGSAAGLHTWSAIQVGRDNAPLWNEYIDPYGDAKYVNDGLGCWMWGAEFRPLPTPTLTICAFYYDLTDPGNIRTTQYTGYVPPDFLVDVAMAYPGDFAFHSPCGWTVDGEDVLDYNPMPTLQYVPEPATMGLLAFGAIPWLLKRRRDGNV